MRLNATFGGLFGSLALALTSCGSSAEPTRHFAAIADTICTNADGAIAALPVEGASLPSLARTAARELPIVRAELSQLAVLTAPTSKADAFARALASTRRETALVAQLLAALRAGQASRVATLALEGRVVDTQAKTAMTTLGLDACAREATPRGQP